MRRRPEHTTYRARDVRAVVGRFERDHVASMSAQAWGEWVDALPFREFLAMCCMTSAEVRSALNVR